jgi:CHAT domain-containing protein
MARKRFLFFRRIQSLLKRWLPFVLGLSVALGIMTAPLRANWMRSVIPPAVATESFLQQGKGFYDRQQYTQALELLQQAVSAFQAQGDELGQAVALSNLSLAHQQLGQWQEAESAITKSLNLLPTASAQNLSSEAAQVLAQTLDVHGRLQLQQGQAQAALNTWQRSADLYEQLEDEAGIVRSQINQAQGMKSLGMYRQAEEILTQAVERLQNQPDSSVKATALRALGNIFRATGNLDRAQQVLEQSLAVAQAAQAPLGESQLSLGNTARAQARPEAALKYYREAASTPASLSTRIQAQLNQMSLLVQENPQTASELVPEIASQLKALPPSRTAIYARINLAENLKRLQLKTASNRFSPADVVQILSEARQQAEELGDTPAISYALGNLAEVYARSGQQQQALDLTQQALYLAQTINAPDIAYRWQWQLGRLQREQGKMTEAIAAYDEAVNNLQSLRNDLVAINPDIGFFFREEVEPVYREYVDLLLQASQPSQENLVRARLTIESLQLAELENFFRSACLNPQEELDTIVDRESSTAAVIYPIVLSQRLETIVKLPQQEKLLNYTTVVEQKELETTVAQLGQYLRDVTRTAQVQQLSQQIYDWLIKPLETELANHQIDTLVFVLDNPLRNIPMSVLYDQERQQYLVEQYAIALTPGLQLTAPQPLRRVELMALTGGISQERIVEGQAFASLKNVARELESVQEQVSRSEELLNQEFVDTKLESELETEPFSVVHLATHGQFSSDPELTYILTWNQLLQVDEFDRLLRQSGRRGDEAIELLVLSACKTAAGDERAALGLAGVAVRAGARSTLASLWSVDDRFAPELMSQFYRELNAGTTKAEALRHAQLTLLQQEKRPYFWAPYVLLGNWL